MSGISPQFLTQSAASQKVQAACENLKSFSPPGGLDFSGAPARPRLSAAFSGLARDPRLAIRLKRLGAEAGEQDFLHT